MSYSVRLTIVGNLGSKPELRETPNGKKVTTLNVATGAYDAIAPAWFRVTVWGKAAEHCCEYLVTGQEVSVEAKGLEARVYYVDGEARVSLETTAIDVEFGPKPRPREEQAVDEEVF
jgi:single-strand DNA-binding protein